MLAVFRVEKNRNYTVMSNVHLRDQNLSLKAKGLLSLLLSLPDDWHYSIRGLAKISKESPDGISSGLKELEKAGYLTRRQIRGEHGRMGQTEYIINKVKEETGMYDAKVVVTGGLGRIISNETENVDVYDPDLTLKGINLVYRKQNRKGVK